MFKAIDKTKHKGDSRSRFRLCVPPCPCYITSGDTHKLCVACLGAKHAESALEGVLHGSSMAAMVAAERHLWLTLSDMREKDRVCLMDALLAPSGLFGNTINAVVDRYQEARKQAALFQRFLPRCSRAPGAAGWEQPPSAYQLLI